MGLQVSNIVKVKWKKEGDATDAMGSTWLKTWDFEDLPELVTVPSDIGASPSFFHLTLTILLT